MIYFLVMEAMQMSTQTYREAPISLGKAGKKYGIPVPTLHYWAKKGKIKVLQRPELKGQALLVDEASIVLALQQDRKFILPGGYSPGPAAITPAAPKVTTQHLIDKFLTAKRMSPKTVRWYQDLLYPFANKYPDYPLP